MGLLDKKKKIFGKIAAAKTLTQGFPKLSSSSSFPSINNKGNSISFLTDLIKVLIGYEALVNAVVDTLLNTVPKIELEIKTAIKLELKKIVSCGVDPHLPSWFKSTGGGIVIEVNKVDFMDMLRTDPESPSGMVMFNNVITPLINSTDFNTFLYGVIQDEGNTHTWKGIINLTFNALGSGGNPNNTLTIKSNVNYDNKTLTELNNDLINSLTLLDTTSVVNKVMDINYGTASSSNGKSISQLENEAKINTIIDKIVNNTDSGSLNDKSFDFTNKETYNQQTQALNRKNGTTSLTTSSQVKSTVPLNSLTSFNSEMNNASNTNQKKIILTNNLNIMANDSISNIPNKVDANTAKLDFIQQIISSLDKSIINILISPKVIIPFIINYKITYGKDSSFDDPIDFIKKNKNLMDSIMKVISEEIIKVLLTISLKEITSLVGESVAKREKERASNKLAQLQTLVGIPANLIKKIF